MKDKTTHTRNKIGGIEHYNGLGMSPRPHRDHQEASGKIYRNISNLLEARQYRRGGKSNGLLVYIETEADFDKINSLTPDVSIYKEGETTPIWVLEVERTENIEGAKKKIKEKLLPAYPSIKEAFLLDYEAMVWYRFAQDGTEELSDKSAVLKRSLARLHKADMFYFFQMLYDFFRG